MDDYTGNLLKKLCCTCLSLDRKLFQLCRLNNGVNNLYWLLSSDSEAYREGFYKNTASLFICWECKALMRRIIGFREQACVAQKQLSSIADGRTDIKSSNTSLSRLSNHITNNEFSYTEETTIPIEDNFVDCGPVTDAIKSEDESEDIPLSELHDNFYNSDNDTVIGKDDGSDKNNEISNLEDSIENDHYKKPNETSKPYKSKKKAKTKDPKKSNPCDDENKNYYVTKQMEESEMTDSRAKRKLSVVYADAAFKCESCVIGFKNDSDLDYHNTVLHTEKPKHTQCDICLTYVKNNSIQKHRSDHYLQFACQFCDYICYAMTDVLKHLKNGHAMQNLVVPVERKRGVRKTPQVMKPGSKPRRNPTMRDKRTPFGFLCLECNKYFEDKDKRYKHTQRCHREGFACETCGKKFAFKNQLNKHQLSHASPMPRQPCPQCPKLVRCDLAAAHARTHGAREARWCAACDKRFVSRASYECHLKYALAHAATDVLKYKCSMCDKGYRSRGELRDHVNYNHMGKTQHKCPICGKALATRRCITRHVRRAHHGVKESARDKICQQCGKAFRDKKGLREHEFIHTGERPLSCEICGCTFRQSASLYTHKKRVHKIYPQKKNVELLDEAAV